MKRRNALKGLLGLTAIGLASYKGIQYFLGTDDFEGKDFRTYEILLSELVDVIIPSTDTPGAKEAQVHSFIMTYMNECASKKDARNFRKGLIEIEEASRRRFQTYFSQCSHDQKIALVKELDNSPGNQLLVKISNKIRGKSFFDSLKHLTIEGYCTSELGATKFLQYESIPGQYKAEMTIDKNYRAWATQ